VVCLPEELLDFIKEGKKFLVVGHKEPDGDSIGSQLALASVLQRMGKEVILCSPGPFKRIEIKKFEPLFKSALEEKDLIAASLIIVDCSSLDRTGALEQYLEGLRMAVIDHHEAGTNVDYRAGGKHQDRVFYIDTNAPSTTFLVKKLIEALGLELTREEAEFLFLGLCTDTGFFRHVDSEGARTFEAAASLIRSGANPKATYSAMYSGKSLNSRKLMGHALINAELLFDGKFIFSFEGAQETSRFGLESRDSDSLYQLLQSVAGVEAIALIRQETPEYCTVGLRSHSWLDVGYIAESFGGGGHKNAAGFKLAGEIAELKPRIITAFENAFNQSNR
jgi:phosphoesterase RecJ-like protein